MPASGDSTETAFNLYALPSFFPGTKTPQIIPSIPPSLVADMMDQWTNCTQSTPAGSPGSTVYQEINKAFADSYADYLRNCTPTPPFLPVKGSKPPAPTLYAFLRNMYGWVPFNSGAPDTTCNVPDVPIANMPPAGNRTPMDYINVQYNFENPSLVEKQSLIPIRS